jgi:hypothetical protein
MTIINLMPFVITDRGDIGLAHEEGTTASMAWCLSQEAFDSISGRKFSWIAPNGKDYVEDREIFCRPTAEEVKGKMSLPIKEIAIRKGYITMS